MIAINDISHGQRHSTSAGGLQIHESLGWISLGHEDQRLASSTKWIENQVARGNGLTEGVDDGLVAMDPPTSPVVNWQVERCCGLVRRHE